MSGVEYYYEWGQITTFLVVLFTNMNYIFFFKNMESLTLLP